MARRKKGRPVSGWLILNKPYELGSTQAVGKIRWLFDAKKAGHAGTLDPLATGVLPIALGEATKTVPYVTDGEKAYRFTVKWGEQTNTDDAEGEVVKSSSSRPTRAQVESILPNFIGDIQQVPPSFSAIKIDGKRAYAEARAGRAVQLESRPVYVEDLVVKNTDDDYATFEVICGKGTYVRAFARDMGKMLGCFGHVTSLHRTFVEPFEEADCVSLDTLLELEGDHEALDKLLVTPLDSMHGFTQIKLSAEDAHRIRMGNSVLMRGRDAPMEEEDVCAVHKNSLLAIGDIEKGQFQPRRVLLD